MPMRARSFAAWLVAAVALVIGGYRALHDKAPDSRIDAPVEERVSPTAETPRAERAPAAPAPGAERRKRDTGGSRYDLGVIRNASERAAVQEMLALIERSGPFRYRQDGVVFENRESRLPRQERGYYHEYTVATPGAKTRGARRIVRGEAGEAYYTNDHYRSFVRLDH